VERVSPGLKPTGGPFSGLVRFDFAYQAPDRNLGRLVRIMTFRTSPADEARGNAR